jgi:uncharacterized protein (TIGR00369 family)
MSDDDFELRSDHTDGIFAHLGLKMEHTGEPGHIVGRLDIGPEHLNRMGNVHGGVLATMIDAAACVAGLTRQPDEPPRFAITVSLSIQFVSAARHGELVVDGWQLSAGHRTYTAEAKVRDAEGRLVANGIGTFQWRKGSEPGARESNNA